MNRCPNSLCACALLLLLLLAAPAAWWPADAFAQAVVRKFPDTAKRGSMSFTAGPDVLINGNAERLAPGVRIRGTNNLLVMPGPLVGQTLLVNYVREPQGLVREIWILSESEAEEERGGMETITNFLFGSSTAKPKVDDGKTPYDQLGRVPTR